MKIGHYRKFLKLTFWMSQLYHFIRGFSTAIPKILFVKPQQEISISEVPSLLLCPIPSCSTPGRTKTKQNKKMTYPDSSNLVKQELQSNNFHCYWLTLSQSTFRIGIQIEKLYARNNYTFTITSTISSNMIGALADLFFTNHSVQLYIEQCKGWCLWYDHLNVLKK